jgi:hypothetical protein
MTPQVKYFFDSSGKQIVKHIARYENLMPELENLLTEYTISKIVLEVLQDCINSAA